jgi:hypothetical protein
MNMEKQIRTDKEKYELAFNGDNKIRQMIIIELLIELKQSLKELGK